MGHRIFVYGTLKKGFHNHYLLEDNDAVFVRSDTLPFHAMYSAGGFPVVLPSSYAPWRNVAGEVYDVSEDCISDLDMLEREGTMYNRKQVEDRDFEAYIGNPDFWKRRHLTQMNFSAGIYVWG